MGCHIERYTTIDSFHRHRTRSETGKSSGTYAGVLAGRTILGKGYMSEAVQAVLNYGFNELQLSLITANCYPHNKRSQQVLKRNGFIYEGTLHQAELTYNGNIYDHECYYIPNIARPTEPGLRRTDTTVGEVCPLHAPLPDRREYPVL